MKKTLFVFMLMALSGKAFSQASDLKYGFRFALGQSTFSNDLGGTQDGRLAFNIGLATYVQLADKFGVSADLHLSSKGTRINGQDTTNLGAKVDYLRTFRLFYAELPLLARLTLPVKENIKFNLFVGPSINFVVISATETKEGGTSNYDAKDIKNVKTVQYDAVFGASFNILNSDKHMYFLDFRYNLPLTPVFVDNKQNINISYFSLGIGYLY